MLYRQKEVKYTHIQKLKYIAVKTFTYILFKSILHTHTHTLMRCHVMKRWNSITTLLHHFTSFIIDWYERHQTQNTTYFKQIFINNTKKNGESINFQWIFLLTTLLERFSLNCSIEKRLVLISSNFIVYLMCMCAFVTTVWWFFFFLFKGKWFKTPTFPFIYVLSSQYMLNV